jgi:agmatinase
MSESAQLPMTFGGIGDDKYSNYEHSAIVVFPVSIDAGCPERDLSNSLSIVEASRQLELYEEETDSEVFKIGIHTLPEFKTHETSQAKMTALYKRAKELIIDGKFICMVGSEHSFSVPFIRAHTEKHYNLSVLQIDSHVNLEAVSDENQYTPGSVMTRVVKKMRIPSVQVGIRSISADEACTLDENPLTKIFWAKDITGHSDWIPEAVNSLTDKVYLTIDISGLDPSLVSPSRPPEPGGLGWYETLSLIRKVSEKHRIVGMDLVEYNNVVGNKSGAFLCAKLIYKILAYIFSNDTPKVRKNRR